MNKVALIRNFASDVAHTHVTIARERDEWGMSLEDVKHPRMILPKDLSANDEGDKAFRKDFISRCPLAKGFSNVTLSILHEVGHYFYPCEYLTTDPQLYDAATGDDHFKLPCEIVATNWAIEWLQNPMHRQMAKAFECALAHA